MPLIPPGGFKSIKEMSRYFAVSNLRNLYSDS